MATLTPKLLANGQVPAAVAALYTVPAATRAVIRTVAFTHVAGGLQTVQLYVRKSAGTRRKFSRAVLDTDEFAHEEDIGTLEAGDSIDAETTNAASVDYSVHGIEVT